MSLPQHAERDPHAADPLRKGVTTEGFLSTEETLVTLGISYPTLRIRIARGYLHPIKKKPGSNQKNYFHPDEIEAERKRVAEHNASSSKLRPGRANEIVGRLLQKLERKADKEIQIESDKIEKKAQAAPQTSDKAIDKSDLPISSTFEGEISSKAFALFEKNFSVRAAVIELKQSVTVVKYLYQEWKNLGPEWLVSETDVKTLRSMLKWNEEPPTFQGFLRAFNDMIVKRAEDVARERAEEIARDMMKNLVRHPLPASAIPETSPSEISPENFISKAEREAIEKIDE
jgi:hypothetical protein